MRQPRPWRSLQRKPVFEHPLVNIALVSVEPDAETPSEDGSKQRDVLVIESNDWVNVVAIEESGSEPRLVLIRQWRFGNAEQTLEIPGGLVDDGEEPAAAARRELLEETGYACGRLEALGVVQPNPALFNNRCHTYLARDLHLEGPPEGDGEEEIEVLLRPMSELDQAVAAGEIQHALVIAALHHYHLRQRGAFPHPAGSSDG